MTIGLTAICLAVLIPGSAAAQYDDNGSIIDSEISPVASPGDPCGSCPDPDSGMWGVTFKDGDMWVIESGYGTIYRLFSCAVASSISTGTRNLTGLGYDSLRELFIVTDASFDVVHQVDMTGALVNSWPAPGAGPVGAAYDPTRDVYWISDWESDEIFAVDPNTGLAVATYGVPEGTRIAGTGYDIGQDAILYNGRDEDWTYWISASTGALFAKFPNPGGGGFNNGNGAAIDPSGNGWVSHYEQPAIFCIGGFPVMIENSSWGSIKALYF